MALSRLCAVCAAGWKPHRYGYRFVDSRNCGARSAWHTALQYLQELDELLSDDLIEEEFHRLQVHRVLNGAGAADRKSLGAMATQQGANPAELPAKESPDPRKAHDRAREQLSELDELLEDELIEEEVHAAQEEAILGSLGISSRRELL
mmetsp:Transcript_20025/g.37659  ORF Transcript_20025/g.37659 Transcript_20025/m.37659 type:complete len:149 (+) Transcript_20025:33-479(+)